jgi:hypothetical protein
MESEHSIDGLRTKLRTLRDRIEALEARVAKGAHDSKLRKLIDEVKRGEYTCAAERFAAIPAWHCAPAECEFHLFGPFAGDPTTNPRGKQVGIANRK